MNAIAENAYQNVATVSFISLAYSTDERDRTKKGFNFFIDIK